ncbi:MAG: anhydro-N-acetylmuramic acid kinase [Hyphomicrobiales bacterium]|nr:anhydro-N-acetylmuramic acid kinase [Hyphomicrobiales bacterium]
MSKLTTALGLMSGTSLDGIDVALIRTDGENAVERGPSQTYPYSEAQRHVLRAALKDAKGLARRDERPFGLARAEASVTDWHVQAVQDFLKANPATVDVIGFHGQTVIHRPEIRLTVQLGDGSALAKRLALPVVYDVRANDVATGGQGAPFVPVYHRALAASVPERPLVFVNIGGVSNVTWIGSQGHMIAFDTGPGNAPLDDWALKHTGVARDEDGKLAATGTPKETIIDQFLNQAFFKLPPPKSLDRDSFAALDLGALNAADGAATLVEIIARAIAGAASWVPEAPKAWIICGGGRHNPTIMKALRKILSNVKPAEAYGFNGDSMEAEAWAYMAVRSMKKLPLSFPMTTKVTQPMTGGVLALP